ncbi:MAG: NAD(P)H-binding protein [Limosilactobacillus sp.]|uniref:NAD(P)H-binding protein n=1 Tax=Limosilactobacillus sp. TaxID=2773925 RepID=UPI002701EEF4|nr:NAD(P)H-binding protein [Limosilactobacillus sp.]
MGRTVIVSRRHDQLSQMIMKQMPDAVAMTSFKIEFQQGDQLCWLPLLSDPVDEQVLELAKLIDQSIFLPRKIVMLSMAGTADDADEASLNQWYGKKAQEYLWAHQYAIKMVDEFELPYTIIRALPATDNSHATITDEGQPLTGTGVSDSALADVITKVLQSDRYNGKSIGVSTKE